MLALQMMLLSAVLLLLSGIALAFLMVLQLLKATFLFCFLSYALMTGGLVLGLIGIMQKRRSRG
ncbi:MAG: hypothetical protein GX883_10685 [Firmicutes bacterium]|nr:hypothetical protein [Bacillota bacterium]